MKRLGVLLLLVMLSVFNMSCPGSSGGDEELLGAGLPAWGPLADCVPTGQVKAGIITSPAEMLWGLDPYPWVGNHERTALGGPGDFMMKNDKAAFVIQKASYRDSYFNFGGNVLDAVAFKNCAQAGPEQFQELQMVIGKLDLFDFGSSYLRAVDAQSVAIINDGSNGQPAHVQVKGTDRVLHMIELNLIYGLTSLGITYNSPPDFGFDITIDYLLPADSQVLQIDLTVHNTTTSEVKILDGMAMFFADSTPVKYPYWGELAVADYGVQLGAPWMAASSPKGDGAWAVAMPTDFMGGASISGVSAALNANLIPMDNPITGNPGALIAISPDGSYTFSQYFSVGGGSYTTAIEPLYDKLPSPLPNAPLTAYPLSGKIIDLTTRQGLPGASITLEMCNRNDPTYLTECNDGNNNTGAWVFLDGFVSDANGEYSGQIPELGGYLGYRLVVTHPTRRSPDPVMIVPGTDAVVDIPITDEGYVYYEVRDQDGTLLPCKITFIQNGSAKHTIYTETGIGYEVMEPGSYSVAVTRGIEYTTKQIPLVTVPSGNDLILTAELDRVVDTSGYMSTDGHIHSGRSPDNYISVEDRIRTCAAEGLEVPVATDHEFVGSWQWAVDKLLLNKWMVNVAGSEVTAPTPGHTNMWPVIPRFDIDVRGGWLKWMGMGTQQIFATERAYGARIVSINHPRSGVTSNANWDPITLTYDPDPVKLGLPANAVVWDWNFNSLEVQNGEQNPFRSPGDPRNTGTFEDWQSFLNMGNIRTAVGVSDAHNFTPPAYARTFYRSPTDSPLEFRLDDLVDAILYGHALVSVGAFARVRVNGVADMGDTITAQTNTVNLWVHIEAIPEIDVTYFKVFVNCDQVNFGPNGYIETTSPNGVVKYDGIVQVPLDQLYPMRDSQIVVMGFGANNFPKGLPQFNPTKVPRFITNAIYVDYDGNELFDAPAPNGKTCSYTIP